MSRGRTGNGRGVQIGFLLLLALCALQAGWWILDEFRYTSEVRAAGRAAHEGRVDAARTLLESGTPPGEVARLLPDVMLEGSGDTARASIDPDVIRQLDAARSQRLNRFVWEGFFFLAVLVAGMAVLVRTLRREFELRRRQENFLAAVSHEFRSPLASMRLGVETLAMREPPPESRRRIVGRLVEEVERLDRLIGNMLDTRRLEERGAALLPEDLALDAAVDDVIESRRARAEAAGVRIDVDVPAGLTVRADPTAISSVLGNLVDNALEACRNRQDGVVRLDARDEGDVIVLTVDDNGRGFAPDEAERLFEKFYRPGEELRRTSAGSGLGLYLVRRLTSLHGGRVSAESAGPGHGARFVVRWPAAVEG